MSEFAERMWKKATRLESEDKFRIGVNIVMAMTSLILAIIEKDVTWFFVACLFALLGLQDFCDTKIKKGLEAVVDIQEKRLNIQEKYIDKLKEKNKEEKEKSQKLNEFITATGGKDIEDITATKYMQILQEGYLKGRQEEHEKAEEIIMNDYISKDKIKEKYLAMEKEYERKVYDNKYNRTEVKKEEMYKSQVYKELLEDK